MTRRPDDTKAIAGAANLPYDAADHGVPEIPTDAERAAATVETVIEHAARAIFFTHLNGGDIEAQARAVLLAIREPTEAMEDAGCGIDFVVSGQIVNTPSKWMKRQYQAMIDAALRGGVR